MNSVFLYHAVQAGLDLAIVNPKDVRPYPLDGEERALAEDLIFDRRADALPRLIAHFDAGGGRRPSWRPPSGRGGSTAGLQRTDAVAS